MGNKGNKPSWRTILWAIAVPVVAIVITVFIVVAITGFEWHLVLEVFKANWILFVSVIALVAILLLLRTRYPKRAPVVALLVIALVLIFSSSKGNQIAETMRRLINDSFDISFLVGGITVFALAVAIATISEKERD